MLDFHCCMGVSLVGVSRGYSNCGAWLSHCSGFSCGAWVPGMWALVVAASGLWSTGSIVVVHGISCSAACEIFLDQGSNPCLLHWQVDSLPLSLQPQYWLLIV